MTQQQQIKDLAREIVGDGKSPNKFFVSISPYFRLAQDEGRYGEGLIDRVLEGFDAERDYTIYGPFLTLEEAEDCFDEHELDADCGIGSVCIEDRETGTVKEKYLVGRQTLVYTEEEC